MSMTNTPVTVDYAPNGKMYYRLGVHALPFYRAYTRELARVDDTMRGRMESNIFVVSFDFVIYSIF